MDSTPMNLLLSVSKTNLIMRKNVSEAQLTSLCFQVRRYQRQKSLERNEKRSIRVQTHNYDSLNEDGNDEEKEDRSESSPRLSIRSSTSGMPVLGQPTPIMTPGQASSSLLTSSLSSRGRSRVRISEMVHNNGTATGGCELSTFSTPRNRSFVPSPRCNLIITTVKLDEQLNNRPSINLIQN